MPSLNTVIKQASRGADLYFVFRFLRLLTMKWEKTGAYKHGIIDKKGKALKKSSELETVDEKASYTMLHRLVFKLRRLVEKVPILGKSILLNYAAALFLLKEQNDTRILTDEKYLTEKFMNFLRESDWEEASILLQEEIKNKYGKIKSEEFLVEKAVSKSQQKFFGLVRRIQKGQGSGSPEAEKVAKKMDSDEVEKFAKTKHKGLPDKKEKKEEIQMKIKDFLEFDEARLGGYKQSLKKKIKDAPDEKPDPNKPKTVFKSRNPLANKRAGIKEGTGLQVKMALSDVGLTGTWKNNKVYVKKKDVKKAEKALKGNVIYKGKPPVVVGEEVEIKEEVTAMDYDRLKKGDIITIEFKSAMSSGKSKFKVTAKNIVGKAKVGKVTLQSLMNPKGVKHFLYKRGNKVSFAQGDMGASVVRYTIEEVKIRQVDFVDGVKNEEHKIECPKCKGEGCDHCDGKGYHIEEEAPTVSTTGVADNPQSLFKKKKKKAYEDVKMSKFAGKDVFIVDSDTYHACRLGKKKYGRYETYVGSDTIGVAIREFGLKYPKRPIILQNGESGPMLYLKYGRS